MPSDADPSQPEPSQPEPAPPGRGRGRYESGLLVVFGWYAGIVATIFVGAAVLSGEPHNCSGFGCASLLETLVYLGMFYGLPVLCGALVVSAWALWPLTRMFGSSMASGTIAAGVGIVSVVAFIAVVLGGAS